MFNLILCLTVFGCVCAQYDSNSPFPEIPCTSVGGTCVIAEDCPKGYLTRQSGLCPQQQPKGMECCYGISEKELRCNRRGGHCVPKSSQCPENLVFKNASDCSRQQKCCILVS